MADFFEKFRITRMRLWNLCITARSQSLFVYYILFLADYTNDDYVFELIT